MGNRGQKRENQTWGTGWVLELSCLPDWEAFSPSKQDGKITAHTEPTKART